MLQMFSSLLEGPIWHQTPSPSDLHRHRGGPFWDVHVGDSSIHTASREGFWGSMQSHTGIFPLTFPGSRLQTFLISVGSGNGDPAPTTISFSPSPFPFCSVYLLLLFGRADVCADICSFHMQQKCCEGCADNINHRVSGTQ